MQEVTKTLNSAFNKSFISKLSQYLHDCVREEVKSSTFRNLKADKDNKWIFLRDEETLFTRAAEYISLDGADSKVTEMMIQSDLGAKDKYLIYGYMFLVGKSSKAKKNSEFLTPLLYMPCRLERNGVNINCFPMDEVLSLNTGALSALMRKDDDDEIDLLLEGILDVVPDLPITQEKMSIFLTTLKSLIPELEISTNLADYSEEDNVGANGAGAFYKSAKIDAENVDEVVEEESARKEKLKLEKIAVTYQSAIILTKRPAVTAGVLHELTRISEQQSGTYRETALSIINEEFTNNSKEMLHAKTLNDFYPVTPLSLSDSQELVIKNIEASKFVAVQGPPGTGKSQTIVNLAAHLIANGKTVLVASRMDKAVDVVAERLNELAPHMALRAGRLNYQRQLSSELNDLINNSDYIDDDAQDFILAQNKDMKSHLDKIKETEKNCEKIIKLEKAWYEKFEEIKNTSEPRFVDADINKILRLVKGVERGGWLSGWHRFLLTRHCGGAADLDLSQLKDELALAQVYQELQKIEAEIFKTGNLHNLTFQIRKDKKKQFSIAVNVLKNRRRESLKELLRDVNKRNRLKIHAKALVSTKRRLQSNILEDEDFRPLLEAFPCWCTTTYAVSDSLPLKPGMFDVAIIDEASQCDIASCFPILFRAKKAVIVGDDKQLPHMSFLEKAKEQSFLSQYAIPDKYRLMWSFRANSMFDLADYYSLNSVMLDEHFRSLAPIINFSNKEFYNGRMRVMKAASGTTETGNQTDAAVETVFVPDGKVDHDATRNMPEIESLVKRLHEIVLEDERKNPDNPVSIGIISPFRAQVDQLKMSVAQVLSDRMIERHQIEIGTAHTFQGDERDVILISWAFADNSYPQSLIFLQKANLFNVAITRGRKKVINFVSKNPRSLPDGYFRRYISYVQEYQNRVQNEDFYKNPLEKEIAEKIRELGHECRAGVEIAGFSADLLVDNKFIIEVDGIEDKQRQPVNAMKKQTILERCGYEVRRITAREWHISPKACLDRVLI